MAERAEKWQLLVSPNGQNNSLSINQGAYISIIETNGMQETTYQLKEKGNGVYFMLIDGKVEINKQLLQKRDATGVWNFVESIGIKFLKYSNLLAIEVPMN